jgi:Protein of unknown function (DUF1761)
MPKLLGVNLLAVLAAAVAMFVVGGVFYSLLFSEVFMQARGITEAEMRADSSPLWMIEGFLIELALAFALGWLLLKSGARGIGGAALFGLSVAALLGFPLMAYNYTYSIQHSLPGLLVDWAHIATSFGIGAAILGAFGGQRAAAT